MCRLLELPRSSFYALSKASPAKRNLEREIVELSEEKPRYGYRRVAALMRRSGKQINVKRVVRVPVNGTFQKYSFRRQWLVLLHSLLEFRI